MNRRDFCTAGLVTGAAAIWGESLSAVKGQTRNSEQAGGKRMFTLNYAPHFGMFTHHAGDDLIDQLKFMADQGFAALEDNPMLSRTVEVQERIRKELDRLGMQMGIFGVTASMTDVTFASDKPDDRAKILADIRDSVRVAAQMGAPCGRVILGRYDPTVPWDYQTVNVIENLKRCAEICEPAGMVMALECHSGAGQFLTKIGQAYMICRAVNSPVCKIDFDMYHQQILEGNLIPNIDLAWEEICYFQIGDHPGRNEPTTGEINYRNIFCHLHAKGYAGVLGMEHGNSKPGIQGEHAVIDAYVSCDPDRL